MRLLEVLSLAYVLCVLLKFGKVFIKAASTADLWQRSFELKTILLFSQFIEWLVSRTCLKTLLFEWHSLSSSLCCPNLSEKILLD